MKKNKKTEVKDLRNMKKKLVITSTIFALFTVSVLMFLMVACAYKLGGNFKTSYHPFMFFKFGSFIELLYVVPFVLAVALTATYVLLNRSYTIKALFKDDDIESFIER